MELRALIDARPMYGYRRLTALLNRTRTKMALANVNHKQIYRLMSQHGCRALDRRTPDAVYFSSLPLAAAA